MEESSSVQYYASSGGRRAAAFDTVTPPSEFFHYHQTFNNNNMPPPSTLHSYTPTFDSTTPTNLASSPSLHYSKNPYSSSSGLINVAAGYQDLPRYGIEESCVRGLLSGEMDYGGNVGGAMYHHNTFHGGYHNVAGAVSHHEGLSLSLASNNDDVNVAAHHFGDGLEHYSSPYLQSKGGNAVVASDHDRGVKVASGRSCDNKSTVVGGSGAASYVVKTTTATNMVGPLGPFTGYATILKSSRFLKPAQELLEEWCGVASCRMEVGDVMSSLGSGGLSSSSTAAICGSNDGGGAGSGGSLTYRPEFHEVKSRLLYLLEEVCKRYKQYHQQMQMVVSSFESVAGLSSSTPYVSLAIKTITRNFKSMKHVISDQLKQHSAATARSVVVGEEELFSSSSTSSTSTRLRGYMGQRQSCGGGGGPNYHHVGFHEPQQHVWRTQRGLPERSVAILRAWLFEHFLHPYPTDADKHMLATQTGLTRNQVSNWFINARVRVWKPMVEEIHMLENKGQAGTSQGKCNNVDPVSNSAVMGPTTSSQEQGHGHHQQQQKLHREQYWKQEKRSRVDFQVPTAAAMNGNGSLMNFLPYQGSDHQMGGGNGAVSLTLGLRHEVVDNVAHQQQQQLQRHGDQLRRQFGGGGGGMMHDFVG